MGVKAGLIPGLCAVMVLIPCFLLAQEPDLPSGLDDGPVSPAESEREGNGEPELPTGMDSVGPAWPESTDDWPGEGMSATTETTLARRLGIIGFAELRAGTRVNAPIDQRRASASEARLEVSRDFAWQGWTAKGTADLLYDDIEPNQHLDLETGRGWLDLRELWIQRRLGSSLDIKAGRQILTWGVGDLLFINDLFAKDWNSFLAGRDEQYLKAPSDALRVGGYTSLFNVNLIYVPRFDADRFIDGRRLSYYSPLQGTVVGGHQVLEVNDRDRIWQDDEWALRLYRTLQSYEIALYGYRGFWKSPGGFDATTGRGVFPALDVFGASARGPMGPGIVSVELGYYHSRDDSDGTDPLVNNSEWRGLLGYEWELVPDTTLALQYYVESMADYSDYRDTLPSGQRSRDEHRQVVTARLTRLALHQNLTLSLFVFYSPTDRDSYWRPKVSYKLTDNWRLEGGMNLFTGQDSNTFFGQFERNSNAYGAIRYSF